jgi:tellurite resistance protein TerC
MQQTHSPALVAVSSHVENFMTSLENGMRYVGTATYEGDGDYHLFRAQDTTAWITFSIVFAVLIIFDNFVLHRSNKALSLGQAALYTMFWVLCAGGFCVYIFYMRGHAPAFNWASGYLLEWMLSFDNIFVFHLIFQIYSTPDELKHKPLFWGICGAVFFRLIFLFIGEYMLHSMMFAHILFGGFLVYTGVQSALADEEDDDPSQNWLVQFLSRRLPFVSYYDAKGAFFVKVPVDGGSQPLLAPANVTSASSSEEGQERGYGTVDFAAVRRDNPGMRTETRATMLFLVVICLEVSDILFAVDSVSAIVAQVPDLFLAYTSAVFAMLGLRAMFFIVDELVQLFQFLKYGVAAILVFVGIKLILGKLVHIPPGVVCIILFATLGLSIFVSWVYDQYNLSKKVNDVKEANGIKDSKDQ